MSAPTNVRTANAHDVVDVMCDAFRDYPVMRFVLGTIDGPDDPRLRTLIGFFVGARELRGEPMYAIDDGGQAVAAATVTLPESSPSPEGLSALRERTWSALGDDARVRYLTYAAAGDELYPIEPHHHLNMIGVRRSHAGLGLARPLLETVHSMAYLDPRSMGVTLSTEDAKNISLYEHFGYVVRGQTRVADALDSWVLYRRAP